MADYKIVKQNLEAQAREDPTKVVQIIHGVSYTAGALLDRMEKDKEFRKLILEKVDRLTAHLFARGEHP